MADSPVVDIPEELPNDEFDNLGSLLGIEHTAKVQGVSLSPDQQKACDMATDWFTSSKKQQTFRLAGFAGTGKTTILPFFMENIFGKGNTGGKTASVAFTNKAVRVMQQKGTPACTIHRLIYEPHEDAKGNIYFTRRHRVPDWLKLIVVDEASMVGKKMREDIESFNVPVLYVGDHGQLPPVGEESDTFIQEAEAKLEKIHRQAETNPIINVSRMARDGKKIPFGVVGKNFAKVYTHTLQDSTLLKADQILCGKNVTRRNLNKKIRNLLKKEDGIFPVPGDRLICLKNAPQSGLINGLDGVCTGINLTGCNLNFQDDTGREYSNQPFDTGLFLDGVVADKSKETMHFDFGYCLTVHKSQGSQYNNVILWEEWLGDRNFFRKWLYTGITRASDCLIVVANR